MSEFVRHRGGVETRDADPAADVSPPPNVQVVRQIGGQPAHVVAGSALDHPNRTDLRHQRGARLRRGVDGLAHVHGEFGDGQPLSRRPEQRVVFRQIPDATQKVVGRLGGADDGQIRKVQRRQRSRVDGLAAGLGDPPRDPVAEAECFVRVDFDHEFQAGLNDSGRDRDVRRHVESALLHPVRNRARRALDIHGVHLFVPEIESRAHGRIGDRFPDWGREEHAQQGRTVRHQGNRIPERLHGLRQVGGGHLVLAESHAPALQRTEPGEESGIGGGAQARAARVKRGEAPQVLQARREDPRQVRVRVQVQFRQRNETGQFRRHRARQRVVRENELVERLQSSQIGGDRAGQFVVLQPQLPERRELPESRGDRIREAVAPESQDPEFREPADLRGDRAGQVVTVRVEFMQPGEVADLRRDGARQVVVAQVQDAKLGELAEFGRDRTRQIVVPQRQRIELRKAAQFRRDAAPQVVVLETQSRQRGEAPEFGGDQARKAVRPQPQGPEFREPAELRRNPARQRVVVEVQLGQLRKVADHDRDRAREIVLAEVQLRDAAIGVDFDPVPVRERRVAEPVARVLPRRAVHRLVHGREDDPVRGWVVDVHGRRRRGGARRRRHRRLPAPDGRDEPLRIDRRRGGIT